MAVTTCRWTGGVAVVCGALFLCLAVWAPGPVTLTSDEPNWLARSDDFRAALADGDLRSADGQLPSLIVGQTSPGVTTMWCGTIGHGTVALGQRIGLVEDRAAGPRNDQLRLRAGRAAVALLCAVALVLFVRYAGHLLGRGPALVAGVVLATEPFLAGHGGVLHTDALVALWSATAVVAYLVTLTARPTDRVAVAVAACSAGLALLTKLNSVPLLVGAFTVTTAGVVAAAASRGEASDMARRALRTSAVVAAGAVAVFIALWPAMWVAPLQTLDHVGDSLHQITSDDLTYFRGRTTTDPGLLYYPVVLVVRATPWLLAGGAIAVAMVAWEAVRPKKRGGDLSQTLLRASLLLAPVPYALVIALTPQRYDRYILPAFPFLALGVGMVVAPIARRAIASSRVRVAVGVVAGTVLALATAVRAPYAIAYVDPLVGQKRAEHLVLLGWGEGIEQLGAEIERREVGHCDEVDVLLFNEQRAIAVPCGRLDDADREEGGRYEYAIRYISYRQRGNFERFFASIMRNGTLVASVRIEGVTYAELWKLR